MPALRRVALLLSPLLLDACSCRSDDASDAFEAWREVRAEIRTSPDHLPARAAALVAAGDVDGLFALVRDDVALVPGRDGFSTADWSVRWGTRATLRGGMGTMRERAELLAELIRETGADAEVWAGSPEAGFSFTDAVARSPARAVAYRADAAQARAWGKAIPATADGWSFDPLDPDEAVMAAVESAVRAAGIDGSGASTLDWDGALVPFVRATLYGATVDFNPNVPGARRGESRVSDERVATYANALDSVSVTFESARAGSAERTLLAQHTWTADEIVGRTVTAAFATDLSFLEAAITPARDAQTFVPILALQGPDLAPEEGQELSVVGQPIDRGGEPIVLNEDGSLLIDGQDVAAPPSDPAQMDRVATVDVQVDASAFPVVDVRVSCEDAGGALVEDLAADAFRVREDGAEVRAVLRQSRAPSPKVLLLFDRSGSLPPEFLAEAPTTGHTIAEAVFDAVPGALLQVAGMDFGGPLVSGPFVGTLGEVDDQLAVLGGAASEVWTNLGETAESEATVIVFVSDFVAEDAETEEIARAIADGPPVLAVAVGTPDTETVDRIVELSSGVRFDGTDAVGVAAAAAAFVAERDGYSYVLRYVAPLDGAALRPVEVGVDADRVRADGAYTAPDVPAPVPAITDFFLTIETNGRSVTRRLSPDLLFGKAVLMAEAGPPSLSIKLDEHLAERLAYEPVFAAATSDDVNAAWGALERRTTRTATALRFAFSAPARELDGPVTYPDGLSLALAVDLPLWGQGTRRSLDWLPLVSRRTALADPIAAFDETLRRTAYLAAIEGLYPTSTGSELEGEVLGWFVSSSIDLDLGARWYEPASAYPGRLLAAPIDGDPVAFWAVDPATGDVVGALADGTGGAVADDIEETLEDIDAILTIAERAGSLIGFGGINVWTQLERTKARVVGAATVLLAEGTAPDFEDIFTDAIEEAADEVITGQIPGWEEAMTLPDDLRDLYDVTEFATGREMPDVPEISFADPAGDP